MSYWAILFIILAIAMAVGPIMLMQPSRRDRRIASYRQKAATLGLQVRMDNYGERLVAVYSLPVKLPKNTSEWQLSKLAYAHDIHFYGRWQLSSRDKITNAETVVALKSFIDSLPDDIVGLAAHPKWVSLAWSERSDDVSVEQIKAYLQSLYQIVTQ